MYLILESMRVTGHVNFPTGVKVPIFINKGLLWNYKSKIWGYIYIITQSNIYRIEINTLASQHNSFWCFVSECLSCLLFDWNIPHTQKGVLIKCTGQWSSQSKHNVEPSRPENRLLSPSWKHPSPFVDSQSLLPLPLSQHYSDFSRCRLVRPALNFI